MWNPQRKAPVKWTGNAARELAHRLLADNGGRAVSYQSSSLWAWVKVSLGASKVPARRLKAANGKTERGTSAARFYVTMPKRRPKLAWNAMDALGTT